MAKGVYTVRGWVCYPFTHEAVTDDMDVAEEEAENLARIEEPDSWHAKTICTSIKEGYRDEDGYKQPLLDIGRDLNDELYR